MAGNDNQYRPGGDRAAVSRALASLRKLEAPVDRIKWSVAERQWRWAIKEIAVVIDSPVATRPELIEAFWAMAGWLRYMAFHCPKLKGRAKGQAMDSWLDLCEPLERLAAMEAPNHGNE
jgi:hypothetical protein